MFACATTSSLRREALSSLRTRSSLAVPLVLLPLAISTLGAQEIPGTVRSGTRVRVSAPAITEKPIIGTVVSVDSVGIALRLPQESGAVVHYREGPEERVRIDLPPYVVPWVAMHQLELSERKWCGKRTAAGAGIGLLAGGVVGVIAGFAMDDPASEYYGSAGFILGLLGAGGGLVIGAAIGAVPHEHWRITPLTQDRLGALRDPTARVFPVAFGVGAWSGTGWRYEQDRTGFHGIMFATVHAVREPPFVTITVGPTVN